MGWDYVGGKWAMVFTISPHEKLSPPRAHRIGPCKFSLQSFQKHYLLVSDFFGKGSMLERKSSKRLPTLRKSGRRTSCVG